MRVNIVNQGGNGGGGFDIAGATLTGPLILAADPVAALEASTKQYVDNAINSLNASHIATGTLPVGRLPAFTGGEVSSGVGSNTLTLANTTVTPGTYTKVTVLPTGRISAGSALAAADIPNLDWSKITNNKPTTVDGYGITDAVKNTTDSVTGFITAHAAPTANAHAATKGYVDSLVTGSATLAVGDTIRRTSTTTPTGFLRCNGGEISKTTYAALYAVVGDQYNYYNYVYNANAQPWKQQHSFNTSQTGTLGTWATGNNVPAAMSDPTVVVTKNWVYILSNANQTSTLRAPINADGSIGSWATVSIGGTSHRAAQAVIIKNKVYLIGGTPSTYTNQVSMATVAADGTIGTFSVVNPLVTACAWAGVAVTSSYVYLIGGSNNASGAALLQFAPINADGTLGTWSQTVLGLGFVEYPTIAVIRDRVYVFGGRGPNSANYEVAYTYVNPDGTLSNTWVRQSAGFGALFGARTVVTKNRVYVMGGTSNGNDTIYSSVYSAAINVDGSLGAWGYDSAMPRNAFAGEVFITSSRVYYIGGNYYSDVDGTSYQSVATFYASFSGGLNDYSSYNDGTITLSSGNNFFLPDTSQTDPSKIYTFIKF